MSSIFWTTAADREKLKVARAEAREARKQGNLTASHSIMLSAYQGIMAGKSKWRVRYYGILAFRHFLVMYYCHRKQLNHNELDVLVSYAIEVRKRIHWMMTDDLLLDLSGREVVLAEDTPGVKPHQLALAYITRARVLEMTSTASNRALDASATVEFIERALALEDHIRNETDRQYGLRQFVRILRKAGELYSSPIVDMPEKARRYLHQALTLAQGEADASDQVGKIMDILIKLED